MGADLQLKVLQLRVLYLNLLFICFDFKILHFIHHLVEGGAQLLEFLHLLFLPKTGVQLSGTDFF